ncbi:group 1 glycosyl transferase [Stutzerimonas stutzeri ATCC 14405 = CCUG 16156]|nr:group 1 glycosyl transferase [Stutzerimonas stutzeri ATCC 14405 = CCUG 16156]
MGLGSSAKIILFGAAAATTDVRKGFSELCRALKSLPAYSDYHLVVFGADKLEGLPEIGMPVYFLGHVSDDSVLRSIYSAADVMVIPSRQETFGLTAAEAMACGTPVVCFGITGLLDIVDHKLNGFAAKPYDSSDLAAGICWVLENSAEIDFAVEARNKILSSFSYEVVADTCLSIYNEMVNLKGERL